MILFIEDADCRLPGDFKFLQNIFHGGDMVFKVRVADIDDMEKDVRFMKFIEGGPEGGEEFLRQVPDKSNRIGNNRFPVSGETEP